MTPSELLASKVQGDTYGLTAQEYQELCEAVLALPSEEQAQWDQAVLAYVHDGKSIVITDAPVGSTQGQ